MPEIQQPSPHRSQAEIFSPYAAALANKIIRQTREEKSSTTLRGGNNLLLIPYNFSNMLPPDLFTEGERLAIPRTEKGRLALAKRYQTEILPQFSPPAFSPRETSGGPETAEELANLCLLVAKKANEHTLSPKTWQEHQQTALKEVSVFGVGEYSRFGYLRAVNSLEPEKRKLYDGKFRQSLYRPETRLAGFPHRNMPEFSIPIGAYGKEFAAKIALTTLRMMQTVQRVGLAVRNQQFTNETEEFLRKNPTLRHQRARNGLERDLAKVDVVIAMEGVLSLGQTVALLTLSKVKGYEDPDKLVNDLVANQVPLDYTRKSSFGATGAAVHSGVFIRDALSSQNGALKLSKKMNGMLGAMRSGQSMCPAGIRTAGQTEDGITAFTYIFSEVYAKQDSLDYTIHRA